MIVAAVFESWHISDGNYPPLRVGDLATLSELQQELIDGLDRFTRGYHWKIEGPSVVSVARAGDALTRSYQGTFKQLFRVSMLDAFERCQTRLRRCSCQRIFLRVGKQKYCSTACAQKTRWERYKPSRATRDYRAERENAIRKRTGANLRIRGKAKR